MGLFSKKPKKEEMPSMDEMPDLPKLPDFPESSSDHSVPQLPSIPKNSFGDEFSKNSIKEAVGNSRPQMDRFDRLDEKPKGFEKGFKAVEGAPSMSSSSKRPVQKGPIYVRIDKVEASLKHLDDLKEKIADIDKMLKKIQEVKSQEEKELKSWEEELRMTKQKIEKIDSSLFSRV